MTEHKHLYSWRPNNNHSLYDVSIFQIAYDEICISLQNCLYDSPSLIQFDIPIKEKPGYAIKVNTASISTDTGRAADLMEFLIHSIAGDSFSRAIVQHLIFDHPQKRATPGL